MSNASILYLLRESSQIFDMPTHNNYRMHESKNEIGIVDSEELTQRIRNNISLRRREGVLVLAVFVYSCDNYQVCFNLKFLGAWFVQAVCHAKSTRLNA